MTVPFLKRSTMLSVFLLIGMMGLLTATSGSAKDSSSGFKGGRYDLTGSFDLNGTDSYKTDIGSSCFLPSDQSGEDDLRGVVDEGGVLLRAPTKPAYRGGKEISPGKPSLLSLTSGWRYAHQEKATTHPNPSGNCGADGSTTECNAASRHAKGKAAENGAGRADVKVRFDADGESATVTLPDPAAEHLTRECPGEPSAVGPDPGFLEKSPGVEIKFPIDPGRFDHKRAVTLEKTLGLKDISAIVLKACPQRGIRSDCELKFSRAKVEIVFKPVA